MSEGFIRMKKQSDETENIFPGPMLTSGDFIRTARTKTVRRIFPHQASHPASNAASPSVITAGGLCGHTRPVDARPASDFGYSPRYR